MLKLSGCALLACSLAACLVGSVETEPPVQDPGSGSLEPRLCNSEISITGQVTGQPVDGMDTCHAVGTWTFAPKLESGDCTNVTVPPQIQINVAWECLPAGKDCGPDATPQTSGEMGYSITMANAPARNHIKFTSGGSGVCEGIVELFSDDGKELFNLHPNLMVGGTLVGQGEFSRYSRDQWDQ